MQLTHIWVSDESEVDCVAAAVGMPVDDLMKKYFEDTEKDELCIVKAYLTSDQVQQLLDRKPIISQKRWDKLWDKLLGKEE